MTSPSRAGWQVLVVDDHPLVAQLLCRALTHADLTVETTSGPTPDAVLERCDELRPDLVVLDLDLGPLGRGEDLIRRLRADGAEVLVLTGTIDPARLGACLEAGAVGVATKDEPLDVLIDRVDRVLHGGDAIGVTQRETLLQQWRAAASATNARLAPFRRLTQSEQAVLAGLVAGASLDAIAAERGVSLATVRTQVRAILQKLDVRTKLEAVAAARAAGWDPRTAA